MSLKNPLSLALAALLSLTASLAFAQANMNSAYLIDQRGVVAKSGYNLCWRTGYWTPAQAIAECDPDLLKKPADDSANKRGTGPRPTGEKVTLKADTLFDFDKATLRDAGKAELNKLVDRIKGINLEVVIAVGHADRFGSDAYNQKLSEKRAASVKDYLVTKGVDANRVYTEGKGKKQPLTTPAECKGPKSKKIIECLQKDRRVEIEVVGTTK